MTTTQRTFSAFGKSVTLHTPADDFSGPDAEWRLRNIYGPYVATMGEPKFDIALDIGAGFGSFCIPFAMAFPQVRIYAFEPQKDIYELLIRNIREHGVDNVIAFNAAVICFDEQPKAAETRTVEGAGSGVAADSQLARLLGPTVQARFQRHVSKPLYMEHLRSVDGPASDEFELVEAIAASAENLAGLGAGFVKLVAPGVEASVLKALMRDNPPVVLSESWTMLESSLLYRTTGERPAGYVRLAGTELALRPQRRSGTREGLDIVVAAYNAKAYLHECVDSLLVPNRDDIQVIVIDDGSSDGSGEELKQAFAGDARLRVVRKPNGGCASARNYGRLVSDASHVAFVDADDTVTPEFFAHLLELSRYSGAEITQGGFDFMTTTESGDVKLTPSYEVEVFASLPRFPFGQLEFINVHRDTALVGQPTIWRRVYRRDFLDAKGVFFPEHIRAFDDQYFQMASIYHAGVIPTLLGQNYHYRQHPAQDIKQFDERHFYELEMFRLIAKRSMQEGWNNMAPILRSFVNTVNWSLRGLRRDLVPDFVKGAAELWVLLLKSLHQRDLMTKLQQGVEHPDFTHYVNFHERALGDQHDAFAWIYLDSGRFHPSIISLTEAVARKR